MITHKKVDWLWSSVIIHNITWGSALTSRSTRTKWTIILYWQVQCALSCRGGGFIRFQHGSISHQYRKRLFGYWWFRGRSRTQTEWGKGRQGWVQNLLLRRGWWVGGCLQESLVEGAGSSPSMEASESVSSSGIVLENSGTRVTGILKQSDCLTLYEAERSYLPTNFRMWHHSPSIDETKYLSREWCLLPSAYKYTKSLMCKSGSLAKEQPGPLDSALIGWFFIRVSSWFVVFQR